jgi:hypothetical protein
MIYALSEMIKNLNITKDILQNKIKNELNEQKILKVLYYDILNAVSLNIEKSPNPDFIRLYLQTTNSLYGYCKSYVVWYVSKKDNSLIRAENRDVITLPDNNLYYLDKFAQNVKIFKIYKNNGKYFIYLEAGKPIYFEMYKGF